MTAMPSAAKAYILYRQKRAEIREAKRYLGVADDLKLSVNAVEVLKKRYLRRDERGLVVETPGEMFERVAAHVSQAESRYGGDAEVLSTAISKDDAETWTFCPTPPRS